MATQCKGRWETPYTKRLSEVFPLPLDTQLGGDIEHAAQTEHRVHVDTHEVLRGTRRIKLQQGVDEGPHVIEVAKKVANAGTHQRRCYIPVNGRCRFQNRPVQRIIKAKGATVELFKRVTRIRRHLRCATGTGTHQQGSEQHAPGNRGRSGKYLHGHFFSFPP